MPVPYGHHSKPSEWSGGIGAQLVGLHVTHFAGMDDDHGVFVRRFFVSYPEAGLVQPLLVLFSGIATSDAVLNIAIYFDHPTIVFFLFFESTSCFEMALDSFKERIEVGLGMGSGEHKDSVWFQELCDVSEASQGVV